MTNLLKASKTVLSKLYNKAAKNLSTKSSIDLLHNKTLLYVVFLVSIVNLMLWMIAGDIMNVIVFVLVGFLTAFFSKNMIVVLVFSLVISNIIKYGIEIGQEGFEDKEGMEADPEDEKEGMEDEDVEKEGLEDEDVEKEGLEDEDVEKEGMQEGAGNRMKPKPHEQPKETDKPKEGMHTLEYSNFNSMANEQNILFANIAKMTPFLVNVDNEAKLRTSLKYEGFSSISRK